MDNKHGKLFVIEQSKKCKFMPKMHRNTFGGRAPPVELGELIRSPRSPSRNGKPTSKAKEGGKGLLIRGGR